MLQGHDGGVMSFSWTAAGQLISGSWDGTAKVWDVAGGVCMVTLGGHENGVCVLGLPDGKVATGSTGRQDSGQVDDFQIRIWSETGQQIQILRDHSGPVRSLDLAPGMGFLSTSNDGSARLWSLDGTPLATMPHPATREGQPAFVLQGCVLTGAGGESVSVDESGGCIVWRGSGPVYPAPLGAVVRLRSSERGLRQGLSGPRREGVDQGTGARGACRGGKPSISRSSMDRPRPSRGRARWRSRSFRSGKSSPPPEGSRRGRYRCSRAPGRR